MTPIAELSDRELLQRYASQKEQEAFAIVVRRHVDWIYSAAGRITRDHALAEDVTQAVFLALSQKASRLSSHPALSGWLYKATRFAARSALERERRREAANL